MWSPASGAAAKGNRVGTRTPARASASRTRFARGIPKPFGVLIFDNGIMKRLKNFRRGFSQCLTAAKRSRPKPTTRKRNEEKRTASEVQAASRGRRTAGARAARPVRELHRQMQARQGWRYPADDVSRRRWRMQGAGGQAAASGCGTTSPMKDEGRAAEHEQGDMRGLFRRTPASASPSATRFARGIRKRSGAIQAEAGCAGLRPEAVYVYCERSHGRAERPA